MEEVEVICKGDLFSLVPGEQNITGLRCRFTTRASLEEDLDSSNVPAYSITKHGIGLASVRCRCTSEVVNNEDTLAWIVHPNGDKVSCEISQPDIEKIYSKLSLLDRYLFVWILLVMVSAVLLGYYVKSIRKAFQVSEIASVSLPIAVGLWMMMYPVLCKVRYELLGKILNDTSLIKNLTLSFLLNWILCPALMVALAWATLPDLPGYRRGVILVGIARCIAMVLIWNDLAKGDRELCAVTVAFNSVLQIALFGPLAIFYVKVVSRDSAIHVGAWQVAKSVLLFLGAPLAAGVITRGILCLGLGKRWYESRFLPVVGPFALLGLLYTIFVMFSLQAHHIVHNLDKVVRVAAPLGIYFGLVFLLTVGVCWMLKLSYPQSVTQAFTATSNNFELAIAVAVGVFGIDSSEALAATIGPLMEVPVLLALVYVMLWLKTKFSTRASSTAAAVPSCPNYCDLTSLSTEKINT